MISPNDNVTNRANTAMVNEQPSGKSPSSSLDDARRKLDRKRKEAPNPLSLSKLSTSKKRRRSRSTRQQPNKSRLAAIFRRLLCLSANSKRLKTPKTPRNHMYAVSHDFMRESLEEEISSRPVVAPNSAASTSAHHHILLNSKFMTLQKATSLPRSHSDQIEFYHELPIDLVLRVLEFVELELSATPHLERRKNSARRQLQQYSAPQDAAASVEENRFKRSSVVFTQLFGIFRPWNISRLIFPNVCLDLTVYNSKQDLKCIAKYAKRLRIKGGSVKSTIVQRLLLQSNLESLYLTISEKGARNLVEPKIKSMHDAESPKTESSPLESQSKNRTLHRNTRSTGSGGSLTTEDNSPLAEVFPSPPVNQRSNQFMHHHDDAQSDTSTSAVSHGLGSAASLGLSSASAVRRVVPFTSWNMSHSTVFKHNTLESSITLFPRVMHHFSRQFSTLTSFYCENCVNLNGKQIGALIGALIELQAPIRHFAVSPSDSSFDKVQISIYDYLGIENWPLETLHFTVTTFAKHSSSRDQKSGALTTQSNEHPSSPTGSVDSDYGDAHGSSISKNYVDPKDVSALLFPMRRSLREVKCNLDSPSVSFLFESGSFVKLRSLSLGKLMYDDELHTYLGVANNCVLRSLNVEVYDAMCLRLLKFVPSLERLIIRNNSAPSLEMITSLTTLSQLKVLQFSQHQLSQDFCQLLFKIKSLRWLKLQDRALTKLQDF